MNWTDNAVMRGLGKICDFIFLNVIWLVCSIPVFTIGASTTALYTVMLKLVKNEEGYIVKGFFKAFASNFKKSTILWLIILAAACVSGADFYVSGMMVAPLNNIFRVIFIVLGFIVLSVFIYVFPLTARYENSVKNTLKNALLLSIAKLPYTLLMIVITAGPVILTFMTVKTMMIGIMLWIVIGGALVAWVNSFILRRVFTIFEKE